MQPKKLDKTNALIQQELSRAINLVLSEKMGIITINFVNVSNDLSKAKIFINSLFNEKILLEEIKKNKRDINKEFIKRLNLRKVPRLEFIIDQKQNDINQVEKILNKF